MKDPRGEAKRWLEQAEHDFLVCQWMLKGSYYSDACFLAQQCSEKALKAYLYSTGERVIYGHSVADLAERCSSFQKEFETIAEDANLLDRFYIQTRYPNALPGSIPYKVFTVRDGESAVSSAERILSLVRREISQGGRTE